MHGTPIFTFGGTPGFHNANVRCRRGVGERPPWSPDRRASPSATRGTVTPAQTKGRGSTRRLLRRNQPQRTQTRPPLRSIRTGEPSAADCHERVQSHRVRLESLREQEAGSAAGSPHTPTISTRLSPATAPNAQRPTPPARRKRSASTAAAASFPSTAFRRRFAQYLVRWS